MLIFPLAADSSFVWPFVSQFSEPFCGRSHHLVASFRDSPPPLFFMCRCTGPGTVGMREPRRMWKVEGGQSGTADRRGIQHDSGTGIPPWYSMQPGPVSCGIKFFFLFSNPPSPPPLPATTTTTTTETSRIRNQRRGKSLGRL